MTTKHLELLYQKIAGHIPQETPPRQRTSSADRWVLSSNLQKSIRIGAVEIALDSARALLTVDAKYFWRRLLVIAYEDIGYANLPLCFDILKVFRRESMHAMLGAERVAAYFTEALAQSAKSRSLCDAIAMLEFNTSRQLIGRQYFHLSDAETVACIADPTTPLIDRVAGLQHICGYSEGSYGSYRKVTSPRQDLMRLVCDQLRLSEIETTLFLSGQSVSESMSISIPLIATLASTDRQEFVVPQAGVEIDGVLLAAIDRHTRVGKACFAKLAKTANAVGAFFRRYPYLDPVAVIGVAAFIVEGSALNRRIEFSKSEFLKGEFETNFLQYVAVEKEKAPEILSAIRDELPTLNLIRGDALDRYLCN